MDTDTFAKELSRCLGCKLKPCAKACPLGVSPHDFIIAAKRGDYPAAAAAIAARNPLPQTCGLVCPDRFCQSVCIRAKIDQAVEIPCLQAEIMRQGGLPPLSLPPANGKKAVIVGGGPAGLGALYELLLNGWQVELYEKSATLGGAARLIPERRLPKAVLDAEIARLVQNERVTIHLNAEIADFFPLGAAAGGIIAALGEPFPHTLGIKGEEHCLPYAGYLVNPSRWHSQKAAVIGGGEVALDCALTLKEQGVAEVEMFVRRRREDMRIMARDFKELEQHGIVIRALASIAEIRPQNGKCALSVVSNSINAEGRAVAIPGSETVLAGYDKIIMALGSYFPKEKLPENTICAGDMSGNSGTVVQALASGRAAAQKLIAESK